MMGIRQLFHQWTTKTLGGSNKLSVSDYELITDRIHVDVENLKAMELKNTVGQATNLQSQSGPIPGTSEVLTASTDTSGERVVAKQAGEGEVWQMMGAVSTSGTGLSGTVYIEVLIRDRNTSKQSEIISTSTTSGTLVPATEITQNPIFIDENTEILVEATGTFTLMEFALPFIRVR